jgi:hypothetical protein
MTLGGEKSNRHWKEDRGPRLGRFEPGIGTARLLE